MAPVVLGLAETPGVVSEVCVTAQHREMLDQVLELFRITPDYDLDLMEPGQDLFDVTARVLVALKTVLRKSKPDVVLVQGDTTTCFAATLAAFYEGTPVGHIEAGLRTGDLRAPFPEEANRCLVGRLAQWHFAPTEQARRNLRQENVPEERIWVTGNTVVDALLMVRERLAGYPEEHWRHEFGEVLHTRLLSAPGPLVLVTGHRRENFGQGFQDLCTAIRDLAVRHPEWNFVYPVHLNPNVRGPVFHILGGFENVALIEPLGYLPFVWLMDRARVVLTDSGGIQEEAPALGKPVLVMREVTERPEGVEAGTVLLVGTDRERIITGVESVLLDSQVYDRMSKAYNPYGDGRATERIVATIRELE